MGKCRYHWILSIALLGVALAVYFEPTHCVRGWLWGEAFFDGRPTSYWRDRSDEWLEHFHSPEHAAQMIRFWRMKDGLCTTDSFDYGSLRRPRRKTYWTRVRKYFRPNYFGELPPAVFSPRPLEHEATEAVLMELQKEERFKPAVERALQNLQFKRLIHADWRQQKLGGLKVL